jgi:hypothetical protein
MAYGVGGQGAVDIADDKSFYETFTDYIFDFDFDDLQTGLAEDVLSLFQTENPETGKMEIDYGKLLSSGTGIASILGVLPDSFTQAQIAPAGYTVPVPKMTATRSRVPGTYDSTRRSGSGGQRYFTDTAYTKEGVDIPDQTAEIARLQAANLANPAREILPVAPTTTTTPANTGSTLLSNYVKTLPTGQEQVAPTVPDVTINRPVEYIEVPAEPIIGARRGGAVADIVRAFSGGDIVPSIPQQVMGGADILSVIRDNIPSTANLTDEEIFAILDATSGMMGDSMLKLVTKAKGGKIRSGLSNIMMGNRSFSLGGGIASLPSRYLGTAEDGMADTIPASIDGKDPAALAGGEFVVAADVVSGLGNGNSEAGAKELYNMMDRVRQARTGTKQQGKQINPQQMMMA